MKTYPHRTLPRKISTHRGPVAVAMPALPIPLPQILLPNPALFAPAPPPGVP